MLVSKQVIKAIRTYVVALSATGVFPSSTKVVRRETPPFGRLNAKYNFANERKYSFAVSSEISMPCTRWKYSLHFSTNGVLNVFNIKNLARFFVRGYLVLMALRYLTGMIAEILN